MEWTSALMDLGHDIGGALPAELIETWVFSDRSAAQAAQLLDPYRRTGIAVCS